jgi:hypothetical protein
MAMSNTRFALLAAVAAMIGVAPASADPSGPPPIRQSQTNRVPACVTPERLMAFIAWRNENVAPKYAGIAQNYKELGEAAGIRWDYAFFQMR